MYLTVCTVILCLFHSIIATRKEKDDGLKEELEEVKATLPDKTQRAMDLACEKDASNWLTVFLSKTWILISTSGNFAMP